MTYIYKTSTVSLKKKGKNWDLTVEWEGDQRRFWINFPFPLLKIIKQEKVGDIKKTFTIHAKSIQTLQSFLKRHSDGLGYTTCLSMLYDLGNQMQSLERFFMTVPFLDISDIIVVDDKHFFYLNDNKVYNFGNDGIITVDQPHKKSPFISPEMEKLNKIPMKLNFKSVFYSLAALVTYCLTNTYVDDENKKEVLAPIYTTTLYYALMRLLEVEYENRFYLII